MYVTKFLPLNYKFYLALAAASKRTLKNSVVNGIFSLFIEFWANDLYEYLIMYVTTVKCLTEIKMF